MPRAAGGILKALVLLAFIACPWLAHLAVSGDIAWPMRLLLAVPHAAVYFFLLWLFGRTLLQGGEPLITGAARRVHGVLTPEIEDYTRRATQAWCCFFAAQIIVSGLLFAYAPIDVWSLFVGILNFPLVVTMFAAEYLYRVMRYPNHPRTSIANMLRAFAKQTNT